MNIHETAKLLQRIELSYEYIPRPPKFSPKSVEVWTNALSDISFADASHALTAWVYEERWPPTIADIREKAYNLKAPADILASQAWDQLIRAMRMAYAPDGEEVWDNLPDVTKMIVGGFATFRQWANTDTGELESVQRPMFIKRLEAWQKRERKEKSVPELLREPVPMLQDTRKANLIEEKEKKADGIPAPEDRIKELRKRLKALA